MQVDLTEPVTIALRTLGEDERRRVSSWFDHLKNWENDEFVRSNSHRLASDKNVYVLRTSSDLRIFFTFIDGNIVVLDIARKDAIERSG